MKMESEKGADEVKGPETISCEEILKAGHETVLDLLTLMRQAGGKLSGRIMKANQSENDGKNEMATWNSPLDNTLKLVLERIGVERNKLTTAHVWIYPSDRGLTNLLKGIEEGLVDEYVKTGKTEAEHRDDTLEKLRKHADSGTELIRLRLMFAHDPANPGQEIPIGCNLFITTESGTEIAFDTVKKYDGVEENSGEYSRIAFQRALRKAKSVINMERSMATQRALSMSLNNEHQLERLIAEMKEEMGKI